MTAISGCPGETVLLAYAIGELPANERALVERHLSSCGGCRASYEEALFETRGLRTASQQEDALGPENVRRARARIERSIQEYEDARERERPVPAGGAWRTPWIAAAALAAAAAVGALLWSPTPREAPTNGEVLAQAAQQESAFQSEAVWQAYRIELRETPGAEAAESGELQVWTDPGGRRSASRWADVKGGVRHATWRSAEDGHVAATVYDRSRGPRLFETSYDAAGSPGLLTWPPTRPARPISPWRSSVGSSAGLCDRFRLRMARAAGRTMRD